MRLDFPPKLFTFIRSTCMCKGGILTSSTSTIDIIIYASTSMSISCASYLYLIQKLSTSDWFGFKRSSNCSIQIVLCTP